MAFDRRAFLQTGALALASAGSLAQVILAASPAAARGRGPRPFPGYGPLVSDPKGLLDLPAGFQYRVFSREGDAMGTERVPGSHDGMAAFGAQHADVLIRNHEISAEDVEEDGVVPVAHVRGRTYDPEAVGGTTTLLVKNRRLLEHRVSLAGTTTNCAGGPTPWDTWLSCEEDDSTLAKPHGYVFEVDPWRGGNPEPIKAMGRFEHEAVAIDRSGRAYLSEDAGGPFGCFYRFSPRRPLGGFGSLHAGGRLQAMAVAGLDGTDLSIVQQPGLVLPVSWINVPNADPAEDDATVREQVIALGATPIQKAEGVWTDADGSIWLVSSRGDGPDAEDEEDRSAAVHAGQIWKYDPRSESMELVVVFPGGSPFDGPDNISAGPHGFALACTDGEDDQWLVGITDEGTSFPFALNPAGDDEFAGATFSPDGETLYVNIQGQPALTFAIWGPWRRR